MATLDTDRILTLAEAGKMFPKRISPTSMWRYCIEGYKARDGEPIKLEHVRMGRQIFVTVDAIETFMKTVAEREAAFYRQAGAVNRADEQAAGELRSAGA